MTAKGVGAKNEETPKATRLICTETVVSKEVPVETKEYEEHILTHLDSWWEKVKNDSVIVIMTVRRNGPFPPICAYIIAPELKGGFRERLLSYLQSKFSGDAVKEKNIKVIPFIEVCDKDFSSMSVSQIKEIFDGFINPSK